MHLETRFVEVEQRDRRIRALLVESPTGQQRVEARIFIDATADIYLARAAGCRSALGPENSAAHGEPSASAAGGLVLNNASLCYRIAPLAPGEQPRIEAPPTTVDLEQIHPITSIRTYANGDRNMNPVNLMTAAKPMPWAPTPMTKR